MLPSEYVDRNCFTGLANVKRRELGMRYEIGIDNMLWGTDFPHPEGTWPNTHEWLRKTFFDIPIDETRRMLGLAAAEIFGFDVEALAPLAEKIGPTPTDLGQLGDGPHGRRPRGPLGAGQGGRPPLAHRPRLPPPPGAPN